MVSESLARRYQAIPIGWEDGKLLVAMADPSNVFAVDDIRALAGSEVRTVVATASQILETIDHLFRMDGEVDAALQAATEDAQDDSDLSKISEIIEVVSITHNCKPSRLRDCSELGKEFLLAVVAAVGSVLSISLLLHLLCGYDLVANFELRGELDCLGFLLRWKARTVARYRERALAKFLSGDITQISAIDTT